MRHAFVLEDFDSLRLLFGIYLEELGFEVIPAGSVGEARRLLETIPALEVALLDYHLPDGHGPEVAMFLRQRFGSGVRIISVSAGKMEYRDEWDQEELASYNAISRKPGSIEDMKAILQSPGSP